MNYITIKQYCNFQELLDIDTLITGDTCCHKEELEYNTWHLSFDAKFAQTLTIEDIKVFIRKLIQNRAQKVINSNHGPATFYAWYEAQSFNLCFDILSGVDISLPFHCKLHFLTKIDPIIKTCLEDVQTKNNVLSWEDFTILNPGDSGWDVEEKGVDVSNLVQDVYVLILP